MSRRITFVTFIGVVIALPIVTALALPYQKAVHSINRRTGQLTTDTYRFGIQISHSETPRSLFLEKFDPLTAPDIWIVHSEQLLRFPWTEHFDYPVTIEYWEGRILIRFFDRAFFVPHALHDVGELSDEHYKTLMKQRLMAWNTLMSDSEVIVFIERYEEQNTKLVDDIVPK